MYVKKYALIKENIMKKRPNGFKISKLEIESVILKN